MNRINTQELTLDEKKCPPRILVAEDNPVNQKLAKIMLGKAGYKVEVVSNGKEAVNRYTAERGKFHLILMDIEMPGMDGLEATRQIREFETQSPQQGISRHGSKAFNVPIVAMTANARMEDREACLQAGMNGYIPKPIRRETAFAIIDKWVNSCSVD